MTASSQSTVNVSLQDIYIADRLHVPKLSFNTGSLTHIIGQNGAGKSTLLHVIAGLIRPPKGSYQVCFSGFDPTVIPSHRCYLTQQNDSVFGLTVAELFRFYTPYALAPEALDQVLSVNQYHSRLLHTLSGGQQQRVHIARCMMQVWESLLQGRAVLLFDEPFDALDLAYQINWLACLHEFKLLGNVIAIAHHQLAWLNECAKDDVLILQAGQIQAHGGIASLWHPDCLTQYFDIPTHQIPLYLQSFR